VGSVPQRLWVTGRNAPKLRSQPEWRHKGTSAVSSSTVEGQSQSNEPRIQALYQRVHQLVGTVHTLQRRCDELEHQDAARHNHQQALQAQLGALTQERDQLKSEGDALAANQQALDSERASLQAERNALQEQRDALQTEREGLQLERDDLSSRLLTLTSEFQELARQRQKLNEQLETLNTKHNELQNAQNRIIAENKELADAKKKLKIKYCGVLSERDLLKSELEKAFAQIRDKPLVRSILAHSFQDLRCVYRSLPQDFEARSEERASHPKSRKFAKTIGSIERLDDNAFHKFAASHTICHYASNTVATYIPKNACTSLRYSFAVANGLINGEQDFDWIHANSTSFCASNAEICRADYTFAILRNPFTRIVSFFLDKLAGRPSYKGDSSYEHARELFPLVDNELTFRAFVSHLWENPDKLARNQHIRSQVDFLLYESYDDLFSVEQLDKAAARVSAKCGLHLYDTRRLSRHTTHLKTQVKSKDLPDLNISQLEELASKGLTPCPLAIYDDELAFKVHAMYASDVMLYQDSFSSTSDIQKWLLLSRTHACNKRKFKAS
jgi:FtsZ-binding cell division protein ZapB